MKRRSIFSVVLALAVGIAVAIWMSALRRQTVSIESPRQLTPTPKSVLMPTPERTASPTPSVTPSAGPLPDGMPKGPYQGMDDPRWPTYWKKREQDRDFEWKTTIEFFGKVVDQGEQPVSGVEVQVGWTDMSPTGSSIRKVVSDSNGLFSVTDERGKALVVHSLRKVGYEEAKGSNRYGFEYAGFWEPTYYEPDPSNPVIFHLRKKVEAEPMVKHGPILFAARNDGNATTFEVENARKAATGGGDIALTIRKGEKIGKRLDWT